ncbi:MAG: hypothetical protein M3548_14285 [Actinomycetota bacterium]|nr:hypothetical protein [Actinomycetota bacterium]
MRSTRTARTWLLGPAVFVLAVACAPGPKEGDRMPQPDTGQVSTDRTEVAEALRFGGITLPPSAVVLGVQHDHAIDERYRVAVRVPGSDIDALLSASSFTERLTPDSGPFLAPIDGYDLSVAEDVESASDTLPPGGDRSRTVSREIAVDRGQSVVHLWLFTT